MPVAGFDHVALPTSDADRFIEFYKKLGFSIIDEDECAVARPESSPFKSGTPRLTSIPRA